MPHVTSRPSAPDRGSEPGAVSLPQVQKKPTELTDAMAKRGTQREREREGEIERERGREREKQGEREGGEGERVRERKRERESKKE